MPRRLELPCNLLHAQELCPFAQMPGVACGQWTFARAPRNSFGRHATLWTLQSSHTIQKYNGKTPERNVNELSLWQTIITGTLVATDRAEAFAALAWFN